MALTEQIVVRLSPEDLHHLEYLALQAGVTRSEMVRRLIAVGVDAVTAPSTRWWAI